MAKRKRSNGTVTSRRNKRSMLSGTETARMMAEMLAGGAKAASSFMSGSHNADNPHTRTQITPGIDHSASLYNRKKGSKGGNRRARLSNKRKRKARKKILKILQPKKCLNVYYEQATSTQAISTTEAGSPWLTQYPVQPVTIDGEVLLHRGDAWGTTTDVNNIITKLSDVDWVHGGTIQNQNKVMNTKAYVKSTLLGVFTPAYDAVSVFAKGIQFDMYECVAQKDINDLEYSTPYRAWEKCLSQVQTWNGSARPLTSRKNYTPFDTPSFGEWWKILNVTRFYQGTSDCTTFKMRQRGLVDFERFSDKFAVKGRTKGLIFVFHPIYNGENTGITRGEGTFVFTKIHRFYNATMENSVTGVPNLSVCNAVTQSL